MVKSVFNYILIIYSLCGFFLPLNQPKMAATGIGLIIAAGVLLIKSVRNKNFPFLIFSLFIVTYCVVPLGYLFGRSAHIIEHITMSETQSTVFMSSHCLLTFLSFFLACAKFDVPIEEKNRKKYISISNTDGYYICLFISILCIAFGVSGDNIFETGGYANGGNDRSSLYEYGIIFIALALIYSRKSAQKNFVYLLCVIYIFKDLLYGGRVSSVMLILAVFIIQFLNSFSFKQILIAVAFGYLFFQFWGYYRSGISSVGFEMKEADGNAQFVVYASMRIHYMIDHGILNWQNRLVSFVSFLLSSFVPSSYLPDLANLSLYKQSDYYSGGGGLVSTFFYCWAWIPGIIFIAIWVGKTINKFFHSTSIYWKFYSLLIIITSPRWFAYYPSQIFKYAVYGVISFFILNKVFIKGKKYV